MIVSSIHDNDNTSDKSETCYHKKSKDEGSLEIKNLILTETDEKVKIIIDKSLSHEESMLFFSYCQIYMAYLKSKTNEETSNKQEQQQGFINTGLEGAIILVINRIISALFIQIYDLLDFKKQFQIELYTNIEKGYKEITPTFHCIEYPSFHLGIMFLNNTLSTEFKEKVILYSTILDTNSDRFCYETNHSEKQINQSEDHMLLLDKSLKLENIENLVIMHEDEDSNELFYDVTRVGVKYFEPMEIQLLDINYQFELVRGRKRLEQEQNEEENMQLIEEKEIQQNEVKSNQKDKLQDENFDNFINAIKAFQESENELDEMAKIRQLNKVKKNNYLMKNEQRIIKVTAVSRAESEKKSDFEKSEDITHHNNEEEGGSIGTKKSKKTRHSKQQHTMKSFSKKNSSNTIGLKDFNNILGTEQSGEHILDIKPKDTIKESEIE